MRRFSILREFLSVCSDRCEAIYVAWTFRYNTHASPIRRLPRFSRTWAHIATMTPRLRCAHDIVKWIWPRAWVTTLLIAVSLTSEVIGMVASSPLVTPAYPFLASRSNTISFLPWCVCIARRTRIRRDEHERDTRTVLNFNTHESVVKRIPSYTTLISF